MSVELSLEAAYHRIPVVGSLFDNITPAVKLSDNSYMRIFGLVYSYRKILWLDNNDIWWTNTLQSGNDLKLLNVDGTTWQSTLLTKRQRGF